jgi:hypothetical protein
VAHQHARRSANDKPVRGSSGFSDPSAELTCHLSKGWSLPINILDLFIEFRRLTNHSGEHQPVGWFAEIDTMQNLASIKLTADNSLLIEGGEIVHYAFDAYCDPRRKNVPHGKGASAGAQDNYEHRPFHLTSQRRSPSYLETAGVKKLWTTVPARRPSPQGFVSVHRAPEYHETSVIKVPA